LPPFYHASTQWEGAFINVLLTKRNTSWNVLYNEISDRLKMGAAVRKLYTASGALVGEVAELQDGGTYVVCL
jgi:hypothetical protein